MLTLDKPLIAEGAGLAALNPDQLVVGLPRTGDLNQLTPAITSTYFNLRDTGLGDPRPFAHPSACLPLTFFSLIENTVAAKGRVVNGKGELSFDASSLLNLRITPLDGSAPLTGYVKGTPVVAMRAPVQRTSSSWQTLAEVPLADALPEPLRALVLDALGRGIKVTALPLWLDKRVYCGYALKIPVPVKIGTDDATVNYRIDVTAGAGFVFPYQLTDPTWKPADVREQLKLRLEADEPPDIVTGDFEARYLASATIASYYRAARVSWGI